MADQNRLLVESPDQRLVVVDDLGQTESFDRFCCLSKLFNVPMLARPFRGGELVASVAEVPANVSQLPDESQAP